MHIQTPGIKHFILAKMGTEAGDYYNKNTIEFLKVIVSMTDIASGKPKKAFFNRLKKSMEFQLKKFLVDKNKRPTATVSFVEQAATFFGFGGTGPTVGHEIAKGELAISKAKGTDDIESIVLKAKEGLTISDRIFEQNGHLVLNYGDQFVPNVVPYTRKS